MSDLPLDQMYPDALGAISRGLRTDLDGLQVALGVFPRQAFLNQPIELILLLQNMLDQPLQVRVTVMLPPQDTKGNLLVLDTPRQQISADLQGGEVGALRIPVIAFPPTQPGANFPVQVSVSHKSGRGARRVRPRAGGIPPSSFAVSAFKLQALRDVVFTPQLLDNGGNTLTTYFDIAPKRLDLAQYSLVPRYETLWTTAEMGGERELVRAKIDDARALASTMTTSLLFWSVYYATEEKWAQRGVQLGRGELTAVTKLLTYTLGDATMNERSFTLEDSHWFQTLCYALLANPELAHMEPGTVASDYLYGSAVYDAILLGFNIIEPRLSVTLGSDEERRAYAEKVTGWLAGAGSADISYLYLPLVLGGVAVNVLVRASGENPWIMLDQLREDAKGRAEAAGKHAREVFEMLDVLLENAEHELTRMNYSRPEPSD